MNTPANKGRRGRNAAPLGIESAPGMVKVLQVVSRRDGFRRASRVWSGSTTVPLSELTEAQYEQLCDEPMLVTMLLDVPVESVADLAPADGLRLVGQGGPELEAQS
ncbi:hypothetical protein [Comamonas terrigena]|uniref:hypothetical protein n=1 Tax=Comamonas terrigena TaxID=32013 RepID=UPI0028AC77FD|nr:hypothetical protein [Comamonas terrigena]